MAFRWPWKIKICATFSRFAPKVRIHFVKNSSVKKN